MSGNHVEDWAPGKKQRIRSNAAVKESLENLLIPHRVDGGYICIEEVAPIVEKCLALDRQYVESEDEETLTQVCIWAEFTVKERAGTFVGARMGRPEKAKERKMKPYIHCIYPIGNAGGPQRNITRPKRSQKVRVELVQLSCPECGATGTSVMCPYCGTYMVLEKRCPRCGRPVEGEKCPACKIPAVAHRQVDIEPRAELEAALKHIGGSLPDRIKCVKRLMNEKRMPENIGKGILRGRYDLSVFKDGTLRFDLTDIPLTHFKPEEVRVSIEKLRELGYTHDMHGESLERPDQMLELMVQDIVIPYHAGEYLVKVTRFLDDLLEDFYKMEPYYGISSPDDVIGHIVLGMAPHTSAAIVGRIVGYTDVRNCYAHPYWHAAKRRNCDGDEDAILMALDPLLNFSRSYLPEQSGGLMDAPLFVIPNLNPGEVDKESHNVDVIKRYPPEFYELCKQGGTPSDYTPLVDVLGGRLGTAAQLQGFAYTKECSNINLGSHQGAYNRLKTMLDKLGSQLELTGKLRAVDAQVVGLKILNSHFMKDIVGNLRAFTRQGFRCSKCNKKYRRPPLKGVCDRCNGPLLMTVYKGGIEKYLAPAVDLVERYELEQYYSDRLQLVREEIDAIFGVEEPEEELHTQFNLTDFLRPKPKK